MLVQFMHVVDSPMHTRVFLCCEFYTKLLQKWAEGVHG